MSSPSKIAAALLAAGALRTKSLVLEGEQIVIQEMSAVDYAAYGARVRDGNAQAIAALLVMCVRSPDGEPVFDDESALAMASRAQRVVQPIVDGVVALSEDPHTVKGGEKKD